MHCVPARFMPTVFALLKGSISVWQAPVVSVEGQVLISDQMRWGTYTLLLEAGKGQSDSHKTLIAYQVQA